MSKIFKSFKSSLLLSAFGLLAIFGLTIATAAQDKLGENGGETVAAAPAASTTLVLSQVDGGGGGSTGTYIFDYVEIKNISNSPQSLNGLSLYYGSAVGNFASTATNAFALPNVTLNPGQYYFVQLGAAGTAGAAFPVTPDATSGNLSMSGTSGKIALVTAALPINTCGATATPCSAAQLAAFVDWVAYGAAGNGTAGNGEGGTSVNNGTAITSSQGAVRKLNGCQDTDNNNNDFDVITAPVPRNSATTPAPCGSVVVPRTTVLDFDADGRTDFTVVRNTGGGAGGQMTWYVSPNGIAYSIVANWGISTDTFVSADFDGDRKADLTVWRPNVSGNQAYFYIFNSATSTVRIEAFGLTGDDPTVVGDYDGDGKADLATYRAGANAGQQSTWFYKGSLNNPNGNITYTQWGQNGDFPAPGDYDGDGKYDFQVQRNAGGGSARFYLLKSSGGVTYTTFGTPTDVIVPGDYDGDGKTDLCVARGIGGQINWFYIPSSAPSTFVQVVFGASTDFFAHGDYDGDGKTDVAVWRPAEGNFYVRNASTGAAQVVKFGQNGDYPVANFNRH